MIINCNLIRQLLLRYNSLIHCHLQVSSRLKQVYFCSTVWSNKQSPSSAPSGNNSEQVANTHVPVSSSSTIWYRPKGGDALRLGR